MKKIFYILASAIVALGAVACENEGLDNINPEGKGETLSFTAEIDNTRVALDGNQTIWVEKDELEIKGYTFVCQADGKTFVGEGDGINAAFSTDEELIVWYNEKLDSSKGLNGVSMKGVGKIVPGGEAKLTFSLQCALLKYTTTEKVAFAGTALSADFELAEAGDGTTQYVAINAGKDLTLSYSVDGVECKSLTTTFEVGYIYNLGNLSAMGAVAEVGGVQYASLDKAFAAAMAVESAEQVVITLTADATITNDTSIEVNEGKNIKLDLDGNTLSSENTRTATHNFLFDVKGGTLTVENGDVVYTHTGVNMEWGGATTVFDVTAGGVLNMKGVKVNVGGTDMNFCVHLNNWGEVTFNAEDCEFNATYCGVRVFNSGPNMNNVTIKNSKMTGATRAFWVQMYGSDDLGGKLYSGSTEAYDLKKVNARLNIDIFGNGNTFELTSEVTSPVRYGQMSSIFFNPENGNQVLGDATDLFRFAQYVNDGLENYAGKTVEVVKDINFEGATFNAIGGVEVSEEAAGNQTKGYFHMFEGTFDGNGKTISNVTFVPASEDFTSVGLFGGLGDKAVVTNLILDNVTTSFTHYAGALVGWIGTTDKNVTISDITVKNSNIEVKPELIGDAYDNGDKAGGIVGYINAATGTSVTGCTVTNTKIGGYRDLGGIVGYARNATIQNNTVDNTVVITVNNDQNYKGYKIQSEYSVADYVGDYDTVGTNKGEATIEWGEIPESEKVYVAQVGGEKFETIEDAITAANGSTIELLANIEGTVTLNKACVINTNGKTFNYTVATGFRATVKENIITIVKLVESVWSITGDNTNWAEKKENEIMMYQTDDKDVFVAYNVTFDSATASKGDSKDYNEFKIRKDNAWTTSYGVGACVKAGYKVNLLSRNTGVEENGTYDIYFNSSTKQVAVMPVGKTWSDAVEPKFDDGTDSGTCAWGIVGTMNGWGTPDVTMYWDGTYWYAKGVQFKNGDQFKLRENEDWDWNYGKNNLQSATNIGTQDDNIKANANCTYDVYVSKTSHKVWFKAAGTRP